MKQITIRRVDEHCLEVAKRRAQEQGTSMNTILRKALEKGMGLESPQSTNGLEQFAADSDFGPEWDAYLDELRQVNMGDWSSHRENHPHVRSD